MEQRLRAVLDLMIPEAREAAGRHEYDGVVQDLSDGAVQRGLAAMGGSPLPDPHDEAHLSAWEAGQRVLFDVLTVHRANPFVHLDNLDLSCYDRTYAPTEERHHALRRHLSQWPDAIDQAVQTLDRVPAPVAQALAPAIGGLAAGVPREVPEAPAALAAHRRLVDHLVGCAEHGAPETAIGRPALEALMGTVDATSVDLGDLETRADAEVRRLRAMLADGCQALRPGVSTAEVVAELAADHPNAERLILEAQLLSDEVISFVQSHDLLRHVDGECVVGVAPESQRWAAAMLTWAAPGEPDSVSRFDITPPDKAWPPAEQADWLSMFNAATMLAVTTHEVAPGHFAHGRALRRAPSPVRRTLIGAAFAEGWAHYGEELMVEAGFRANDPRYVIGVALEALCRVTRLACAIGLHTGSLDVAEATERFRTHAYLSAPVARSEAQRGTFDPGYGIYTWGKWEIMKARERARDRWGSAFTLRRFHDALLNLGSPPLGLLGTAVDAG